MPYRAGAEEPHTGIPCWFCEETFSRRQILRDGIIRGRNAELGGPFRLLICPSCRRENVCEKTPAGRWFSSPNLRFSFFDYLFSQILDPGAEDLLAAISWFRDNEERRRYFFEKDGDRRYSGKSFLLKLWPMARVGPAAATRSGGARKKPDTGADARRRGPSGDGRGAADEGSRRHRDSPPGAARARGVVSPYEILGVSTGASEREIHLAFHRLAIDYHPDKVHHLGEEFQRIAHEKFTRLKAAYETLLARRAHRAE
jgi:DnaJ-domain-containing protein 1